MTKTYQGNTPELYELFLKGEQLQYSSFNEGDWVDLPIYTGKPNDIYRVSAEFHRFRVKPKDVITKAYMHYDDIEMLVQDGNFDYKVPGNCLFGNNKDMDEHLEFTFTNGKLTKVEMKDATN